MTAQPGDPCLCGHVRDAHEHYRPGMDCGACGAVKCPRFQPAPAPAPVAADDDLDSCVRPGPSPTLEDMRAYGLAAELTVWSGIDYHRTGCLRLAYHIRIDPRCLTVETQPVGDPEVGPFRTRAHIGRHRVGCHCGEPPIDDDPVTQEEPSA